MSGDAYAPAFWLVASDDEHTALADPRAPIISLAPAVVALTPSAIAALPSLSPRLPHERFWLELRGGTAPRPEASVLGFSVAPGRLTSITADGDAFTVERDGFRFPTVAAGMEEGDDDATVVHVLFTGLFAAACALLDAPGIVSRTVERREPRLGAASQPVRYDIIELDPSRAAEREAWLAALRKAAE